jgi:hypothetical protein
LTAHRRASTIARSTGGGVTARDAAIGFAWVTLAAALRLPPLQSQLWLDEVWTLRVLEDLPGALAVFTEFKHSNNHPLLTLWMQALGPDRSAWLYRVPSWIAGIAGVWLAWRLGARGGRREAEVAAGLAAVSSLLVHYASEARGYELAIAAGLASFAAVGRILDGRVRSGALVLAASAAVGMLSQLLYLEALAGAGAWLAAALWHRHGDLRRALYESAQALAPAAAVTALLVWIVYLGMELGGGEDYALAAVALRALSHAGGGPSLGFVALLAAAAFATLSIAGLRSLAAAGRVEWVGYLVASVVAPAALLAATRPDTLPVRWFVLPVAFAYLACAAWLAKALAAADWRRLAAAAALAAFACGNAHRIVLLYRDGRGDYRAAVRFLAEHDPAPAIRVASDHDFRNRILLRYYGRELPPGRHIAYVPNAAKLASWPPWLLVHRYGPLAAPPESVRDPSGRAYVRAAEWPSSDLSGFRWTLYRRADH